MPHFIRKNPHRKYVRPLVNTARPHKVSADEQNVSENNKKINESMNTLDAVKAVTEIEVAQKPKRNVKIDKKDKGLYERTENSKIVMTEDNKMLLND